MIKANWQEVVVELKYEGLKVGDLGQATVESMAIDIEDLPAIISTASRGGDNGRREYLILSLYGQDEEKVVSLFSRFMEYEPFCKYQKYKGSITYNWLEKGQEEYFKDIQSDPKFTNLQRLEKGFNVQDREIKDFFLQVADRDIETWKGELKQDPEALYMETRLSDILPFIEMVMPRISTVLSLNWINIISLTNNKVKREEEIIRYGLEPLITASILNPEEVQLVIDWFKNIQVILEFGGESDKIVKLFGIEGVHYELFSCFDDNHRYLSVRKHVD